MPTYYPLKIYQILTRSLTVSHLCRPFPLKRGVFQKTLQIYYKKLNYTNNSAFFRIFAANRTLVVLLLRFILQNYNKKTKGAKDLTFTP